MTDDIKKENDPYHEESENEENVVPKPRSWIGCLYSLLSAVLMSVGGILITLYKDDSTKIVLVRCLVQYLFLLPVITIKKQVILRSDFKTNLLLVLRGMCGPIVMASYAEALRYIPLGDAVAVCFTHPALVFLFACICLKEKCGIFNIGLTIVNVVGLVFITQPSFIFQNAAISAESIDPTDRLIGVGLSLVTSMFAALTTIIIRKLGPEISFTISLFYYSLEGFLMGLVYLAFIGNFQLPCLHEVPVMVAVAIVSFCGQILVTMALQRERAGPVTLIKTTEVMFSFLFQYFVSGIVPSLLSCIGAVLILSCSISIGIKHTCKSIDRE